MEASMWVSSFATVVIAVATIVYVYVTRETLISIRSQIKIANNQLLENIRSSTLIIQPVITLSNASIKIKPFSKHRRFWNNQTDYGGNLSVSLKVENQGLGPAFHVILAAVLLSYRPEQQSYVGLFSQAIPAIAKQEQKDVTCNDFSGMSAVIFGEAYNKELPPPSFQLYLFALFQDVSSQSHMQYQIISSIPSNLTEKLVNRVDAQKKLLGYSAELARKSHNKKSIATVNDEKLEFVSVDYFDDIAVENMSKISPILLNEEEVNIEILDYTSKLISRGLPDPLQREKNFETLKKRIAAGKFNAKSEKEVMEYIVKTFSDIDPDPAPRL